MSSPPKLIRVVRLDSMPLEKARYTDEGYLFDKPVLTSVGIFEYSNNDGSIRRELRLPEEVFAPESLASYRGRPVVITHDAGLITKDNVMDESIGTILSDGIEDGDDVRAEIVIHDTDAMKKSRLKELSLGYNLDLEEKPGVWKGEHYDAIQRNIRINHLALVREARAGDQARLNIDSRDTINFSKGGKPMKKRHAKKARRNDGVLSPDELKKAIEEYKKRRASRLAKDEDEDDEPVAIVPPQKEDDDDDVIPSTAADAEGDTPEEKAQFVKDCRRRRDEEGDPDNMEEAMGVIAQQDDDMDILFDIIDTLLAEKDFDSEDEPAEAVEEDDDDDVIPSAAEEDDDDEVVPAEEEDDDDEVVPAEEEDDDDEDLYSAEEEDDDDEVVPAEEEDDDDEEEPPVALDRRDGRKRLNADSIDRMVRERVRVGMIGQLLHMDGLENMPLRKAKKAVIRAVRPGIRLDGKSNAYISAMFDCAVADIQKKARKGTKYQRKQMFNADSRGARRSAMSTGADAARKRMISRQKNKEVK